MSNRSSFDALDSKEGCSGSDRAGAGRKTGRQSGRSALATPANVVTVTRIAFVPVFVFALICPWPDLFPDPVFAAAWQPWVALFIFVLLSGTDAVDGHLARSRNEVSNFGKFVDPLADKILVAAALLCLVELQELPSWVALIILAREFIISGLRMMAASEGLVIAASWYGKAKTVTQIVAVCLFIVKDSSLAHSWGAEVAGAVNVVSWVVMTVALVLTVVSMVDYFAKCLPALGLSRKPDQAREAVREMVEDSGNFVVKSSEGKSSDDRQDASANGGTPAKGVSPMDAQDPLASQPYDVFPQGLLAKDVLAQDAQVRRLACRVVELAKRRGWQLSTAESCTGGLISAALTSVPGSSEVVQGGIVSYSNQVKHKVLGVSQEDLNAHGAVSEPVAKQMAQGSRRELDTQLAVSVTGIAGPGGAVPGKPVGTVWFGVSSPDTAQAEVLRFDGNRDEVRLQTVIHALSLLERALSE